MPMPPDMRDGPRAARPESRPKTAAAARQISRSRAVNVPGGGDDRPMTAARRRRATPSMRVSLFAPSAQRGWWWFTGRCRVCGSTAFGRVRTREQAAGIRRASCGHRVELTVARVYLAPPGGEV